MKHAPNDPTLPNDHGDRPAARRQPGGLTAGLDWAKDDHVVCVVDAQHRTKSTSDSPFTHSQSAGSDQA